MAVVSRVRAVFIDWYGTLSVSRLWEHWSEPRHPRHSEFQKIQAEWNESLRPLVHRWCLGEIRSEAWAKSVAELINIPVALVLAEMVRSCRNAELVSPEIVPLVRAFREADVKVFIATDNSDSFDRWTVPELGLNRHFDGILNSSNLGVAKFDSPEIFFGPTLSRYGIDPQEAILLDDSAGQDCAVVQFGMICRQVEFGTGLLIELEALSQEKLLSVQS